MKDFEQLKSVWLSQPKGDQLTVDEALTQVKKGMSSLSRKIFWSIAAMGTALAAMFYVLFFMVFQSWLTYLGIIIMLLTLVIFSLLMIRDYRLIYRDEINKNSVDYLEQLKVYQKSRSMFYGWVYYLYLLLLSTGLFFYLIEILESTSIVIKVFTYTFTFTWFLLCTFYFKNKIFKNEKEKVNFMIGHLERLKKQFN
jgi:hypothetical protein